MSPTELSERLSALHHDVFQDRQFSSQLSGALGLALGLARQAERQALCPHPARHKRSGPGRTLVSVCNDCLKEIPS